MNARSIGLSASLVLAVFVVACGTSGRSAFGTETAEEPTVGADNAGGGGGGGGFSNEPAPEGNGHNCAINATSTDLEKDFDGDGYALKDDCNECNTSINKGAQDVPGNGIDEDCSGTADDEEIDCDTGLDIAGSDPYDGARAMGLCKKADPSGRDWGVISAKWVRPDGKSLGNKEGIGILPKLGVNSPQTGSSMLFLSSGTAREPSGGWDPLWGSNDKRYQHGTPPGYPKESPACPGVTTGAAQDGVALELKIRVPSNAKSFSYQQNFFTFEYPEWVCDEYNDFFVTIMNPAPDGLPDGNIAFDQDMNPISVNNSLLQVCNPGTFANKTFTCPLGTAPLAGTGFEGHAATGWLTTSAPVTPGSEITLLWAIWDSGDGNLDSSVLIDDFKFSIEEATTGTQPSVPK